MGRMLQLQVSWESPMKLSLVLIVLLLSGCGAVTSQSIYEGLRTQQSVKNAGVSPPPENMKPYERYEKEREKLKGQE